MMPDLDGWTVLAAIKGDPELADIPVILVTIVDEKNRGYALGATDYMVKPVDRERLVGRAAQHLRRDRAARCCWSTTTTSCGAACGSARAGWLAGRRGGERPGGAGRLAESRPDVDHARPHDAGDGWLRVPGEMRSRAEWRDIPVLVVTAKDLTAEERAASTATWSACCRKAPPNRRPAARDRPDPAAVRIARGRAKRVAERNDMKILYVEDNEDNIYMLERRLRRAGFDVLIARDGAQGVAMARASSPI